ncbi:MAG: SdiA-regulated domain-containing protein [Acetobacteraceae bacterium]
MALGHGSIAFVGFNADGNDNIAFVTLDAIPAGTVIFFQDNEWNGSAFNTGESSWSWTTASDIDPGVVVRIDSIGASQATDISTNVGTVAFVDGANRGLSASDEIVYAFIGSDAATPSSFLAAVGSNALTSGATLAGTDLIAGDTALSFGDATGVDIGAYNGSRSGEAAFADYRPAINDPANWQTQDSGGDQSADGTPPDAPFATTPFSLAVGEETQSVGFAPASVTVAHLEGNAGSTQFVFTVQRTGGTTGDVGFTGQITSTQAEAADFADSPALPIAFSGTIAAGATTADVTVNVAGDVAAETAEAFTLTLQSVANADPSVVTGIGAQEAATGSILDDDAPLSIGQVQGTGHVSSMAGQVVTLTGVVTAVDTNGSRGFYLQDGGDGTPLTSDGIFVFLPSGTLPSVGHEVQVTGKVSEFTASGSAAGSFSTTELTSVAAINDLGVGAAVAPTVIGGPGGLLPPTGDLAAGGLFFESLEGMLITVKTPVAVGPTNSFGEIFTVVDGDADPGNGLNATGLTPRGNLLLSTGTADFGDNDTVGGDFNPERIQIDDDNGLLGGFTAPAVNVGATLTDVTGVVGYSFGNYEVLATQAYAVQTPSPLTKETGTLTGAADRLLVASYNAENLDPGDGAVRFATIAQEIVATLNTPDIIALQEVQDNDGATDSGTTSAATTLQTLVDAIAAAGGPAYAFVDNPFVGNNTNGGEPGGNIRTAFLYRTDRVDFVSGSLRTIGADGSAVTGSYADQQTNPDNPFFDSRPPLVASFTFNGSEVTVINNHFTSKGGSAALLGSQQPPLNAGEVQRAAQAQAVNTFVDGRLAANPVANIIVAGDLNEFPSEQPMQVLKGTASVSGYDVPGSDPIAATGTLTPGGTPVLHDLQDTLPADQQYDYVFEGNSETLDHILASNALASGAQFDPVHINAEFADQTSDHDPLLASFSIPGFSLSNYVRIGRFDLPEPTRTTAPPNNLLAQEVSAVTYDWDTDTLFVVGDGGTSIVQISKSGQLIDSMTLAPGSSPQGTEFYDTEGLTYIGDGRFVMVEERDRQAVAFTYAPGTTLTRADTQTVKLGTFAGNTGLEGLSFDKQTGDFIFAKETDPESIFQSAIDFAAGTATNGSPTTENSTPLFDPSLLGLADIADVYSLANVTALQGQAASGNLLVLSQESGKIVETDRSGHVVSTLTLTSDPGNPLSIPDQQHEGVAMDAAGNLYVVSENGGGDFDHPQLWVFAPSAAPNQAPTAIALTNQTTAIAENTSTATRLKVADIVITDDGLGASNLALTGADAAFFEVDNTGLYIKAGTALDFEAKASYAVTVTVDDPSVGAAPDATAEFTLSVTDLVNENPGHPQLYVSEVAPWSSGNSPVAADWFEITNAGTTALDITGWKMDDSSGVFGSAVSLLGITSIGAGESVVFLETDDLAAARTAFINTWFGGTPPAGLQIGNYTGSGVGLSTGGDEVNLFDASGVLQAGISFGASPSGPFPSFNNAVGLNNAPVTTPSAVGENGAFAAANDSAEIGSPGSIGRLIISEVAPWSSGSSPVGADWFEVTNTSPFAIDITGWKVDDSSGSPAAAIALSGITSIAAGESVIFIETADLPAAKAAFLDTWFGANPPANLQIGSYSGSGVGLGTSGDAVNLYDAGNTLRASVTFGASPSGPFATFDNAAGFNNGTISALSTAGTNGAAAAAKDAAEVGSPGVIAPRPYTLQLLHFYGESGILAADTAPIVGAMVDKFRGEAANTLVLAEGDTWIPGPWLVAGADPSLNAVPGIGSTALGRPRRRDHERDRGERIGAGQPRVRPGIADRVGGDRSVRRVGRRTVPVHHRQSRLLRRCLAEAAGGCLAGRQCGKRLRRQGSLQHRRQDRPLHHRDAERRADRHRRPDDVRTAEQDLAQWHSAEGRWQCGHRRYPGGGGLPAECG